jgi:hypothetical protein
MDLDWIYTVATRVKQKLHCSQQVAEYTAWLLALEHTVSKDSFQLLAEMQAIHALHGHSTI